MRAIDLFPYWADNRSLLLDGLTLLHERDLDTRPAPGLASVGELLRHVITTQEHWWHGGILGRPWAEWRPNRWETLSASEKAAYRSARFPTIAAIRDGLAASHAPIELFLRDFEADDLCEKRRATWGEDNTLRWIFWHLVEHDQHHRAQLFARLRILGRECPATFPRPGVMAATPAAGWVEPADMSQIIPYWNPLFGTLRDAVTALAPSDLEYRPAQDLESCADLMLRVLVEHDRVLRSSIGARSHDGASGLPALASEVPVRELQRAFGDRFPTGDAIAAALDRAYQATQELLATVQQSDLFATQWTAYGPQTLHHALWYAREHVVHHRAHLFLWMRMSGGTPPEI